MGVDLDTRAISRGHHLEQHVWAIHRLHPPNYRPHSISANMGLHGHLRSHNGRPEHLQDVAVPTPASTPVCGRCARELCFPPLSVGLYGQRRRVLRT